MLAAISAAVRNRVVLSLTSAGCACASSAVADPAATGSAAAGASSAGVRGSSPAGSAAGVSVVSGAAAATAASFGTATPQPSCCAIASGEAKIRGSASAAAGRSLRAFQAVSIHMDKSLIAPHASGLDLAQATPGSTQPRAVPSNLHPHLSRCRAAQNVAGIERSAQAQHFVNIFFNRRAELLQHFQRQLRQVDIV